MSRALGDFEISSGKKIPGVLNEPQVQTVAVEKTTEFVLLATDGIFDNLRPQTAVTHARKVLRETRDCKAAAAAVLEQAAKVCTSDNAAVIVVALNLPEPAPKRAAGRRFQLNPSE